MENNNSGNFLPTPTEILKKTVINTVQEVSTGALARLVEKIGLGAYRIAYAELDAWAVAFGTQRVFDE